MLIPQTSLTFYIYMTALNSFTHFLDYYEPTPSSSKFLISGVTTDTACRVACDYTDTCNQYILSTSIKTGLISCFILKVPTKVTDVVGTVLHPYEKNIIIGMKSGYSYLNTQNYNAALLSHDAGVQMRSIQMCFSIGKTAIPTLTEISSQSTCGLPPKIGFRLAIDGSYCSTAWEVRPFSCDLKTGLIILTCPFGYGLYPMTGCVYCNGGGLYGNPTGPCTNTPTKKLIA